MALDFLFHNNSILRKKSKVFGKNLQKCIRLVYLLFNAGNETEKLRVKK